MGVFFVDENGGKTQISQNDPKRLTVLVPSLLAGTYTLQVVTRFSNGSMLLNAARTIVYDTPLVVE